MDEDVWYRKAVRWGQTNLVEIDPERYDAAWWRDHWKKTRTQGVIINAGGIVAYYPSKFPLHNRAIGLGDTDLLKLVVDEARAQGLAVIARMDSNRVTKEFLDAHPEWICRTADGEPIMAGPKYVTCINSPYYTEYLPDVMREIVEHVQPDGFADNSWAGLPRSIICYCDHCKTQFKSSHGHNLPADKDWEDQAYLAWIEWNYQRRIKLWEFNNDVTMAAGGEHCRWMGMIAADLEHTPERFIDLREILRRTPFVMLDHQGRFMGGVFEENTEVGKRVHELAGWDVLAPESMAQYRLGKPVFRQSSLPEAEVRLWMTSGFAGGIQPWWHHIGAQHEDRRQYAYAEPILTWHEANEDVLVNRKPLADVGVVWSQRSVDFYGRNDAHNLSVLPFNGAVRALDRAGIPTLPVHVDDLDSAIDRFKVLVLPNVAILNDAQKAKLEAFVAKGGSLVATSETGLYDSTGKKLSDFALADLFGVHLDQGEAVGGRDPVGFEIEAPKRHTYLRLLPELRAGVYGPKDSRAPEAKGTRHPVLAGFESTDSLPFGGYLPRIRVDGDVEVIATLVENYPIYPPETSFTRTFATDIPTIAARQKGDAKLVWLVGDLDRCYGREDQADHAQVIANAVRWALGDKQSVGLEGGYGMISTTAYEQGKRTIVHLNNRLQLSAIPGQQYALLPVGPVTVRLKGRSLSGDVSLRVAGKSVAGKRDGETISFTVDQIFDHEVAVLE